MTETDEGIGCRYAVTVGFGLVIWAIAAGALGLTLVLNDACSDLCRSGGLSLFYAAAPVSALFGVLGGGVPIAWPLDGGVWIMAGFGITSWAARRRTSVGRLVLAVIGISLLYGIAMSQFVEIDRLN